MADEKPSYLKAMLTSQGNLYALLSSAALGTVLSIPYGFGVGALPLIAFAAGEAIAAMYLPASISFRDRVDRQARRQARQTARNHLLQEIEARCPRGSAAFQSLLRTSERMSERIAALYDHAASSQTRLSMPDVERLEDAAIDFLKMRLAVEVIEDRASQINLTEIERRIASLDREIAAPRPGSDLRQLRKARAEYVGIIERYHRMSSRKRALEAAMLSMPDQMEEIYQTIMTGSSGDEGGAHLEESIARLRLQEDIEAELAGDMRELSDPHDLHDLGAFSSAGTVPAETPVETEVSDETWGNSARPGSRKAKLTAINGSRQR